MTSFAQRLAALVEEARAAGELGALAPALGDATTAAWRAADEAAHTADVPRTFGMVGESPALQRVFALIEKVASSDVPVLVQGETGTGKELVARALHTHSPRARKRLLAENCAAVPANLLESELFGHVRGSFTGATADRDGHFVAADGGTLFLDEIGDMPLEMQAKLLRALETGEVRPVGSNKVRRVDVRVVAATNKDLAAMTRERTFREDLYFRLNVVRIELPRLSDRDGDVPHLVRYFLAREAPGLELLPAALEALVAYDWPGNVRELENEVKRAAALARGPIGPADLSPKIAATTTT